jgi:S1-C subfamily serine protease
MSGGPTFDSSGKVVGVNVARAGAELSLFVPSQFLASLLARAQARGLTEPESFSTDIARQLVEHLRPARAALARDSHQMQRLGRFQAPTVLDDTIRCWDRSRR